MPILSTGKGYIGKPKVTLPTAKAAMPAVTVPNAATQLLNQYAYMTPKPTPTYAAPAPTNNTAALQAAVAATPAAQAAPAKTWDQIVEEAHDARVASYNTAPAAAPVAAPATKITPYTPQAYSVNLPSIDWSFNPTGDMRSQWQNQATATAGQEIDPQLQAIVASLQQYMTQGQNTRNELNPRYTNQSLSIANVIQNSVKQDAIDNAIRRGADTSGWLPSALMDAGKLEAEQRSGIEANRNQDLNALAALEAQQAQAAGQQNVGLEKLRGQRITTALQDLENQAWQKSQQEKESQWNSALGGEQLRASNYGANESNRLSTYQTQVGANQSESQRAMEAAIAAAQNKLGYYNTDAQTAMSNADRELQASMAANEQANTEWGQANTVSQQNYGQQQDALSAALRGVSSGSSGGGSGTTYIDTPYGRLTISQATALGYIKPGPYADKPGPVKSAADIAIENAIQAATLKELSLNPDGTPINKAVSTPRLY